MSKPKPAPGTDPHDRIAELEDKLKQSERRVQELKADLDKERDLVSRMREHVESCSAQTESWIEAFDMVLGDDGKWHWNPTLAAGNEWFEKYSGLLRQWNAAVNDFNSVVAPRNVGRPLEASEAQRAQVLKLRKGGMSLRAIADEVSLGLQTVRTIVGQRDGTDRTTVKYARRIDPERTAAVRWRARQRTRDGLPKRINESLADGRDLVKEAKGLK